MKAVFAPTAAIQVRTFSAINSALLSDLMNLGGSAQDEQIRQSIDDVGGIELALDADHERLLRELVDDVERAEYSAVVGPVLDEIIGPDMVGSNHPA